MKNGRVNIGDKTGKTRYDPDTESDSSEGPAGTQDVEKTKVSKE